MRLPHVTYGQAKKLKELGYDEYCGSSYISRELCRGIGWKSSWKMTSEHGFGKDSPRYEQIPAPLYVEVEKWLRDNYSIHILIDPGINGFVAFLDIKPIGKLQSKSQREESKWIHKNGQEKGTYESAQADALDYIIENFEKLTQ